MIVDRLKNLFILPCVFGFNTFWRESASSTRLWVCDEATWLGMDGWSDVSGQKPSKTHCQPVLRLKAFFSPLHHQAYITTSAKRLTIRSAVSHQKTKEFQQTSPTRCFPHSAPSHREHADTRARSHSCHQKSLTKVLRSPSLYDCTSWCEGVRLDIPLHVSACWNWFCIIQVEENNCQHGFWNRKTNKDLKKTTTKPSKT